MRKIFPVICVIILFIVAPSSFGQAPAKTISRRDVQADTSQYRTMVERVKAGDTSVDFIKFRTAYLIWTDDECNVTDAPNRDEMVKVFDAKDYAKATTLADSVLDYEYTNRGLHRAVANAYKELGNSEKAVFHQNIADRLMKALLNSGDGKSAETAYRVFGVNEEYVVMRELGYTVSSQSLVMKKGGEFDVLTGNNSDGKEASFYFDFDHNWIGNSASKPCKLKK